MNFHAQHHQAEFEAAQKADPLIAERRRAVSAEDDVRKLEDMLSAIAELARRALLSRPGDPPLSTIASICRAAGIEPKKRC